MAAGCVPVATHLKGITDLIVEDGVSGFLCPLGSVTSFAEKVTCLAQDRARLAAMAAAGRTRVGERFSLGRMAEDYDRLFIRALAEPPVPYAPRPLDQVEYPKALEPTWRAKVPQPLKTLGAHLGKPPVWPDYLGRFSVKKLDPSRNGMVLENNKPQVMVAQMGARMHYAVPLILHRAGMLAQFFTDTYVGPGSILHFFQKLSSWVPEPIKPLAVKRLLGRNAQGLPAEKVTAFNLLGVRYAWALHRVTGVEDLGRIYGEYDSRFVKTFLREKLPAADAIYVTQIDAFQAFRHLQGMGMRKIYEQAMAPLSIHHRLYAEEDRLWPGWESPYPNIDFHLLGQEWQRQGWELADAIVCPSEFVAQGLKASGISAGKIFVIPYGINVTQFTVPRTPWRGDRPLRLLFLGGVRLGKGPQYLLSALSSLHQLKVEVRFVGPVLIRETFRHLFSNVGELTGQVARSEVPRHLAWADVFVFPSICEGSATVVYEALAAGLPVITTPNAGSVVRDGVDGYIIPIRDAGALAEKIDHLAQNPELLMWMSDNARKRALDFSLERYGQRLSEAIIQVCKQDFN